MEKRAEREMAEVQGAVVPQLSEAEIYSVVVAGGGKYVGVLKELPGNMESVILFSSPRTRTTLSLTISQLTAESVSEHLAESDAEFAEAAAK
jgi:hypothetical protein